MFEARPRPASPLNRLPSKHEPDMPTYLRFALAIVAAWGAALSVVWAADYVQPAFPALLFMLPTAIVVGIVCFYEGARRPELKSYFDKGFAFAAIVVVGSICMIAAQYMIEGGTKKGAVAAFMERYKPSAAARVQTLDPIEVAKQKIARANYTLDNTGYVRALAQGSDVLTFFNDIGIFGDETSLRHKLLTASADSVEFRNIGLFMQKAASGIYAANVRGDFYAFIAKLQKNNSLDGIRNATCSAEPTDFVLKFIRNNLHNNCASDGLWFINAIDTIKYVAEATIYKSPTSTSSIEMWLLGMKRNLVYHPLAPRPINYAEMIALASAPYQESDFVRGDAIIGIDPRDKGVEIFKTTNSSQVYSGRYELGKDVKNAEACFNLLGPKCRATITLQLGGGAKVLAIDNIRTLATSN